MVRNELVHRSPLRILEKSTHGGLGKGNIGIITAAKGIGKTACLVHIATDQLLKGKHVIHVSFSLDTSHIISWYEDIFQEIAKQFGLESAMEVHDDIIKNRIIVNYHQDGVSPTQVQKSIASIINEGGFSAEVIVIDGYDFAKITPQEFASFKKFAADSGLEIWFSATPEKEDNSLDSSAVLSKMLDDIAILILLEPCGDYIHFKLIKDHATVPVGDLHLKLDTASLLIAEDK